MTGSSPPNHRSTNRFDSEPTLATICDKLKSILNYLCKLDHSNILKFYDYWQVDNAHELKLVVITEYSAGGSLRKVLDSAKRSRTRIKASTYNRWLNQILYSIKCLHNENMSFFQGHLASDTIFIQNSGVIKLAPTLLSLSGVCELSNGLLRCTATTAGQSKKLNIDLTDEFRRRDFQAIGKLALEIFTAHIKSPHSSAPSSPHHHYHHSHLSPGVSGRSYHSTFELLHFIFSQSDEAAVNSHVDLSLLEDEMQRDFCLQCLSPEASSESIWFHPFINNVHTLKVLSVFSILSFFQDKRAKVATSRDNEGKGGKAVLKVCFFSPK
jgi:serine/threonine protein kinase